MQRHTTRALVLCSVPLTLATLATLTTCADHAGVPDGAQVHLAIAPLVLPSVVEVCYGLTVYNAPAMGVGDTVWSNGAVCSTRYGNDGGGDVAYVGPCDADTPAPGDNLNYVRLVLNTIEVPPGEGSLPVGPAAAKNILDNQISVATSGDGDADFNNPCVAPLGCTLSFACVENTDVQVEFDLTVMVDAGQGFFDIAVTFEDMFCSGKYDTCYVTTPGAQQWNELLSGDDGTSQHPVDGPGRDRTGVLALACTVGPDTAASGNRPAEDLTTTLDYSDVVLTCSSRTSTLAPFALPLALAAGNHSVDVAWGAPTGTTPLQYATYFGVEQLDCAAGLSCNKSYFDIAIDLEDIPAGWTCSLAAQATATHGPDTAPLSHGALTAAGTNYPFVDYQIADVAACQQNPLDVDGSDVATAYASTFGNGSNTLQTCYSYAGSGNPTPIPGACGAVAAAATALSTPVLPGSALVGGFINASAILTRTSLPTGPVPAQLVTFTLSSPSGSVDLTATTDVNGLASVTFTPTVRRQHTLSAHFAGGAGLAAATSGTTSIAVYQRTSLAVAPASGAPGVPLSVSATLTEVPGGAPITGKTITFGFGGDAGSQTATTDGSGVATVDVTFAAAGSYTATASFADAAGFYTDSAGAFPVAATTGSASLTVETTAPAPTSLSSPTVSSALLVGNNLVVKTYLTRTSTPIGALEGQLVTFTLTAPDGASDRDATTDVDGSATLTLPLTVRGPYTVSVSFVGGPGLQPATSSTTSFAVYAAAQLVMSQVNGTAGTPVTIRATLTSVYDATPIIGASVLFTLTGGPSSQSALSDVNGTASITVTYSDAGTYSAIATFSGQADYWTDATGSTPPAAAGGSASVNIALPVTQMSDANVPTQVTVGSATTSSVVLSRITTPSAPVGNELVTFTITDPNGVAHDYPTSTNGTTGLASLGYTFPSRGAWTVAMSYAGSAGLAGTQSGPYSVSVYQRASLALAPASGAVGTTIVVHATLTEVPGGAPIVGQTVTFDFTGGPGFQSATTNSSGVATVSVSFEDIGVFDVHAHFANAADYFVDSTGAFPVQTETANGSVSVGQ